MRLTQQIGMGEEIHQALDWSCLKIELNIPRKTYEREHIHS